MSGADVVFRSQRVMHGLAHPCSVHVRDGRITAIKYFDDVGDGPVVDVGDLVLMPGLVDTHVHVNEPGRTDWEGFATATAAAAAGGVTTIVDMPLNSVPATTSVAALETKIAAARGKVRVDVGFWGGVVPGNTAELAPLVEAGALGFKCFMVPSGVDEFEHVGEADLREAMPVVASLGVPLLVHAELPAEIQTPRGDPRSHESWLRSRPDAAETRAIELLIRLASETGARVHVVHVSSRDSLTVIREARARGVRISAETCPHYLTFAAEDVPDGATEYKCAPPLRERKNLEDLWWGVWDRDIEMIVSDHSPAPPDIKDLGSGDFFSAWGGVASLEVGLSAVWTGIKARRYETGLGKVIEQMAERPARLAGLPARAGFAPGRHADFVVFDPDVEWTVDPERLHQRHKLTPYAGKKLRGRVEATYLRGDPIYQRGDQIGPPRGELVLGKSD